MTNYFAKEIIVTKRANQGTIFTAQTSFVHVLGHAVLELGRVELVFCRIELVLSGVALVLSRVLLVLPSVGQFCTRLASCYARAVSCCISIVSCCLVFTRVLSCCLVLLLAQFSGLDPMEFFAVYLIEFEKALIQQRSPFYDLFSLSIINFNLWSFKVSFLNLIWSSLKAHCSMIFSG